MRISTASLCGSLLLATIASANAGSVDAKLLDMLLKNGSITTAQHAELTTDLAKEQRVEEREAKKVVKQEDMTAFTQLAGWAATTKLTGDMRVREDIIDIEETAGDTPGKVQDKDRQRIRARLGAITQVNSAVEVGIQVATGNDNANRSTNQDIDNYFTKKDVWLDLGYIDYHPTQVPGLKLFGGKMKQPWMALGDAMWDADINPEGFAAAYKKNYGTTTLFGSGGYFVLKDNVDGEGVEFNHDLNLVELQIGTAFDATDDSRLTIGGTINDFTHDTDNCPTDPSTTTVNADFCKNFRANGNTTKEFQLWELFSQLDVIGLPLPLTLYGQYIVNADASDWYDVVAAKQYNDGGEDTAWLFGFKTNLGGVAIDYNYRDVEVNAVVGGLTDSDFSNGWTGGEGHKIKLSYDILKNFGVAVTYFNTENSSIKETKLNGGKDGDVDTLMLDVNAKF